MSIRIKTEQVTVEKQYIKTLLDIIESARQKNARTLSADFFQRLKYLFTSNPKHLWREGPQCYYDGEMYRIKKDS